MEILESKYVLMLLLSHLIGSVMSFIVHKKYTIRSGRHWNRKNILWVLFCSILFSWLNFFIVFLALIIGDVFHEFEE